MSEDNFISGIYNYCDRWCERCVFTKRCVVFAQTEQMSGVESGSDLESFFEKLKDILEKTHKILDEKLKEIYPDGIPQDVTEEYELKSAEIERKIDENPLYQNAKGYSKLVRNWFEANEEKMTLDDEDVSAAVLNNDVGNSDMLKNDLLRSVVEIIMFYQYFIEIKIKRALFDKYEFEDDDEDLLENILTTQKLILLAITRSLASWEVIYDQVQRAKEALNIMIYLEKLKRSAELAFPEALSFKRPYFD